MSTDNEIKDSHVFMREGRRGLPRSLNACYAVTCKQNRAASRKTFSERILRPQIAIACNQKYIHHVIEAMHVLKGTKVTDLGFFVRRKRRLRYLLATSILPILLGGRSTLFDSPLLGFVSSKLGHTVNSLSLE